MICLPRACRGRAAVRFPANSSHMCCVELALKRLTSAGKGLFTQVSPVTDQWPCHAVEPSMGETAAHGSLPA